jgi:hypothetical protein
VLVPQYHEIRKLYTLDNALHNDWTLRHQSIGDLEKKVQDNINMSEKKTVAISLNEDAPFGIIDLYHLHV